MEINPIRLEIFRHLFSAIADEMGIILGRSAYSPNIKERKDYSCALFDAEGRMIAQAEHIYPTSRSFNRSLWRIGSPSLLQIAPTIRISEECLPALCLLRTNFFRK